MKIIQVDPYLSKQQKITIRNKLSGSGEKKYELIKRLDSYLGYIEQVHKRPSIDTTLLSDNDPAYLQITRVRKQADQLLRSMRSMPEKTQDLLSHQWEIGVLDDAGFQCVDEPLLDVQRWLSGLIEQADITLQAHKKPPRRPRNFYSEAQAYAIAKAVSETYGQSEIQNGPVFKQMLDACISECNTSELAKKVKKDPRLGSKFLLQTREFRRAKR